MEDEMDNYRKCPKCGDIMIQIPIKRLDSTLIIELYCEKCDNSVTIFPERGETKFKLASYF